MSYRDTLCNIKTFFLKIKRDKVCKTPNILSDALTKHSINACHSLVFYLLKIHKNGGMFLKDGYIFKNFDAQKFYEAMGGVTIYQDEVSIKYSYQV